MTESESREFSVGDAAWVWVHADGAITRDQLVRKSWPELCAVAHEVGKWVLIATASLLSLLAFLRDGSSKQDRLTDDAMENGEAVADILAATEQARLNCRVVNQLHEAMQGALAAEIEAALQALGVQQNEKGEFDVADVERKLNERNVKNP